MSFFFEHTYQRVDLDRFVETYFSEAFNLSIADAIGLEVWERLEWTELADGCVRLRTRVVPKATLPAAVRRMAGNLVIEYEEVSIYEPAARRLDFQIEHGATRYIRVAGTVRFVPVSDGVRRLISGEIEVHIPAIRGIVQRVIRAELHKAYARKAVIMQCYLDDHAGESS